MRIWPVVKLVVVHYHFRPGGVRRVIELATPHLARALTPPVDEVILAAGEPPDRIWLDQFRACMRPVPVTCRIEPAMGYVAERRMLPAVRDRRLNAFLGDIVGAPGAPDRLVWAHNQGLGRNLLLTRALGAVCEAHGVPLVFHHHDWWFDNRWSRWQEMRESGFRTLRQVARAVWPAGRLVRHVAVNQADVAILRRSFPGRVGWLPNPADGAPPPAAAGVARARRWLAELFGEEAPVWLVPCRLLRRKNLAEALLLTRWLRPEAWLVTTGGVSSAGEQAYAAGLARAAARHGWKLRLGVLNGRGRDKSTVAELLAASEVALLTSLQEGFGLPYLEAAASRRPLIARELPNVAPDLARLGFGFPQSYRELLVAPGLFDWKAERKRQRRRYGIWRRRLPRSCRELAGRPAVLAMSGRPRPAPFSRLTLTAQLQVLSHPAGKSWELCRPLNPFLARWRDAAASGDLALTHWPEAARAWLGGPAYARRFAAVLEGHPAALRSRATSMAAQERFIRERLRGDNLYPLLWGPEE